MAELRRATEALIAYALASRPDWAEDGLRTAIGGATGPMSWTAIHLRLSRLMADPHGQPGDLLPIQRNSGQPPATDERREAIARAARADLENKRPRTGAPP